jgi:hypothetical protein
MRNFNVERHSYLLSSHSVAPGGTFGVKGATAVTQCSEGLECREISRAGTEQNAGPVVKAKADCGWW